MDKKIWLGLLFDEREKLINSCDLTTTGAMYEDISDVELKKVKLVAIDSEPILIDSEPILKEKEEEVKPVEKKKKKVVKKKKKTTKKK